MAFMSQERKNELTPSIKAVLAKYGVKATIAVNHHSCLVVNIKSGKLDLIGNYIKTVEALPYGRKPDDLENLSYLRVNEYSIDERYHGECREFLNELKAAMMVGNHDRSDSQTDYFDVGWYIDINVGRWDKPYIFEG